MISMKGGWIEKLMCISMFSKQICHELTIYYSWLSKTRILNFSNLSIAQTNSSVPWTLRTSLGKKTRYLEYLGRSDRIIGPLDDLLLFSRTFVLTFRPKFESSKVERFIRFFGKKKVFSFSSDVFLVKMAPVKWKRTNKSLAEKCIALKNLENGLSNKDVATKYGVLRNTVSTWVKNKNKLTASLEKREWTPHEKIRVVGTTKW